MRRFGESAAGSRSGTSSRERVASSELNDEAGGKHSHDQVLNPSRRVDTLRIREAIGAKPN